MEDPGGRGLIVVGTDGSPASSTALPWALGQAVLIGAEVEAITARAVVFPHAREHHGHPAQDLHEMARKVCARVDDVPEVIEVSRPSAELVRASHHADLLVLGTRGCDRTAGALLGGVVGDCVRGSACPVVVVPLPSTG